MMRFFKKKALQEDFSKYRKLMLDSFSELDEKIKELQLEITSIMETFTDLQKEFNEFKPDIIEFKKMMAFLSNPGTAVNKDDGEKTKVLNQFI